jgi:hypothetical protein
MPPRDIPPTFAPGRRRTPKERLAGLACTFIDLGLGVVIPAVSRSRFG